MVAAEEGDAGKCLSLCNTGRVADYLGEELFPVFRLEARRMNCTGAGRKTGAFLRDGREAFLVGAELAHHFHRAMMLAISAATCGQIRFGVRVKHRRDQREAEQH